MARGRVRLGGIAWILTGVYFPANAIVAARWSDPAYDFRRDTISRLGETSSPWPAAANISWVVTGLAMVIGAILAAPALPCDRWGRTGLRLVGIDGVGLAIVGLNPDDVRPGLHVVGAVMSLVGGNLALLTLGLALRRAGTWPWLAATGLVGGIAGLASLVLMQTSPGGSDTGLFERIAADPVVAWYLACGVAVVVGRVPSRPPESSLGKEKDRAL